MVKSHIALIVLICVCIAIAQIYMFYMLWVYKKNVEDKNVRLIQFYLDMKFIWKCLVDNLNISNTVEFCYKLMGDIKDYYSLDDIIVIDSLKIAKDEKKTPLRRGVIEFVNQNIPGISKLLRNESFFTLQFTFEDNDYTVYITSITPEIVNDGLAIAIETGPTLLSKNELISLENSINILKTRLMYS